VSPRCFETAAERELEDPWEHKIFHLQLKVPTDLGRYRGKAFEAHKSQLHNVQWYVQSVNMALPTAYLASL